MLKNVVFDFDGTLVDSARGIIETEYVLLRELNLPLRTEEQIRAAIGLPLAQALHVGGNIPLDILDKASERYHELFFEVAPKYVTLFDGVRETLEKLESKKIPMAIATSRSADSLEVLMKAQKIDRFFNPCITADKVKIHKPEPEPVLEILRETGWKAEETLVTGDTTFDILMGNRAGCRTLGVTYGNHSGETLLTANPTYLVDRFEDILNVLQDRN